MVKSKHWTIIEYQKETSETSFFFVIDNKLNWEDHIMNIASKIFRGIGTIIKTRDYLNKNCLLAWYNAFIYSYITYCNHIWGATNKSNLTRLVKLQNKVARKICHVKSRESCKPFYKFLGVLPFEIIYHNFIGCYCIGSVLGNSHPWLINFYKKSELYT